MILVIQTVRPEIELRILDEDLELIAESRWMSAKDEVSRVLPEIEKLLAPHGGWKKMSKIVVFNGIGGFASTRIGVTVANTLALVTGAELYEVTCEWEAQSAKCKAQSGAEEAGEAVEAQSEKCKAQSVSENVETYRLVKDFMSGSPLPVKIAQPKYKFAPMISTSKQKIFN